MAADDILIKIRAQIDEFRSQVNSAKESLRGLSDQEKATNQQRKATDAELTNAAKRRKQLIQEETQQLKQFQAQLKTASSVKEIKELNSAIATSKTNIATLSGETAKLNSVSAVAREQFLRLGAVLVAAFGVESIIRFGSASVKSFREAESSAKLLQTAITNIGGEGEEAFNRLIAQATKFQDISIFTDEQIQGAQIQLAQFGLLSNEIERAIPLIVDFASAQRISIGQATDSVIQGINGVTRGLRPYGLEFKNTGDKAQNFGIILEKLNRFQGQTAAVLETSAGRAARLGNVFDELKETIGGLIESTGILRGLGVAFEGLISIFKTAESLRKEGATKILQNEVEGLQTEIDAAIKKGKTFEEAIIEQEQRITNAQKLRREERARAAENDDTVELNRINGLQQSLKLEAQALQLIKEKNKEVEKTTKLGLTEEEKSKQLEASQRRKEQALERERKLIEQIQQLRIDVEPDEAKKIQLKAEVDQASLKDVEVDLRGLSEIEKSIAQRTAEAIILINLKKNQDLGKINLKFQDDLNKNLEAATEDERKAAERRLEIESQINERLKARKLQNLQELNNTELIALRQILEEEARLEIEAANQSKKTAEEKALAILIIEDDLVANLKTIDSQIADNFREVMQDVVDVATSVLGQVDNLLKVQSDNRISALQAELDALTDQQDIELRQLEDQKSKKLISEQDYRKRSDEIAQRKIVAEKKVADAVKEERRKEAQREKLFSIFKIGLILAEAIASLNVAKAIIAAAELIIVTATPLPFKHGTKGRKDTGLGIVGEEGQEMIHMPKGTQVVPAPQTKKYRTMVDAMIDNKMEDHIMEFYVYPALIAAQTKRKEQDSKSFADNIVQSLKLNNNQDFLDEYGMGRALKKGVSITNVDALAKAIANQLNNYIDPRRF